MHRTLVLLATVALLGACASAADDPVPATRALATEPAAEATVPARPLQFEQPPPMQIDPAADYVAEIVTSEGPIVIDLFEDTAPSTVNNFVFLARQGYYNGVIFHRVIPGFMIQGGDPTGTGRGGPGYTFPDELNSPLPYARGIVAMANAGPNTNGSQFFIMHSDYGLPYSYSIFGNVIEGLDTVDAIAGTELSGERPVKDVVIEEITITGP